MRIKTNYHPSDKYLIYLHGSGLNIGANLSHARRFKELGFSVLLISYRGYGQSDGNFPTEVQVYADAEAAWNYLVLLAKPSDDVYDPDLIKYDAWRSRFLAGFPS